MNVQYAIQGGDIYRAGGQSARQPHRALRRQGHRPAGGRHRRARDGGRDAGVVQPRKARRRSTSRSRKRCCPSRASPASTPILGPEMRSTGEVMGAGREFRPRLRQEPDRRRHSACRIGGTRVHLGQGCRQGPGRAPRRASWSAMGFSLIATRGTAKVLEASGPAGRHHQQGAGRPPACGGRAQERRDPPGVQHHRGRPGAGGLRRPSAGRP